MSTFVRHEISSKFVFHTTILSLIMLEIHTKVLRSAEAAHGHRLCCILYEKVLLVMKFAPTLLALSFTVLTKISGIGSRLSSTAVLRM